MVLPYPMKRPVLVVFDDVVYGSEGENVSVVWALFEDEEVW